MAKFGPWLSFEWHLCGERRQGADDRTRHPPLHPVLQSAPITWLPCETHPPPWRRAVQCFHRRLARCTYRPYGGGAVWPLPEEAKSRRWSTPPRGVSGTTDVIVVLDLTLIITGAMKHTGPASTGTEQVVHVRGVTPHDRPVDPDAETAS
jgi:hypothetical protein